jgi:amino acid transporter
MTPQMAIVGMIVGAGLVVFGVIVLLKYPDRPGGKIKWRDIEISSEGPGLIIIVLGVIVFVIFTYNAKINFFNKNGQSINPSAFDKCFGNVPEDTIVNLEEGSHDKDLISLNELKNRLLNIKFTDNGKIIGGIQVKYFPDEQMFKIISIINPQCEPVKKYINASRGQPHHVIQNWDVIEMQLGKKKYAIRLGYKAGWICVNYFNRI